MAKPPMVLYAKIDHPRTVEKVVDGQKVRVVETITFSVELDVGQMYVMAEKAAKAKTRRCTDGALSVAVSKVEEKPQ